MKAGHGCGVTILVFVVMIALSPIWIPGTFIVAGELYFTTEKVFELDWGLDIPDDFNEVYRISHVGVWGDGPRFTVYKEDEGKVWAQSQHFQYAKSLQIEAEASRVLVELNAGINIEKDMVPFFDKDYLWSFRYAEDHESELIIIYFPDERQYYFIEMFV
jgi:hypothetical protein